jgi:tRNA threonylcarbamoyladenosine biosynthesis protein TsaB
VLVLALDTTTRAGSVAVARDDEMLALVEGDGSRTHGERLPGEIENALQRASVQARQLDLLVVSSGPGAFTGLRIGLAAIQGLAMVLGKLVVGVSALEALADAARAESGTALDAPIATWMDAARGEVFAAAYRTREGLPHQVLEPLVGSPREMLHALPFAIGEPVTFIGDGARHYREPIEQARPHTHIIEPVPLLAPALARLGRRRAGAAGPPHALQPVYVRRPDAELDREKQAKR